MREIYLGLGISVLELLRRCIVGILRLLTTIVSIDVKQTSTGRQDRVTQAGITQSSIGNAPTDRYAARLRDPRFRETGGTFFQDSSDRAGAEPAFHQAAEAIVDLRSRAQIDISGDDCLSNIVIADDIARADDHSDCAFWLSGIAQAGLVRCWPITVPIEEPAARLCRRL